MTRKIIAAVVITIITFCNLPPFAIAAQEVDCPDTGATVFGGKWDFDPFTITGEKVPEGQYQGECFIQYEDGGKDSFSSQYLQDYIQYQNFDPDSIPDTENKKKTKTPLSFPEAKIRVFVDSFSNEIWVIEHLESPIIIDGWIYRASFPDQNDPIKVPTLLGVQSGDRYLLSIRVYINAPIWARRNFLVVKKGKGFEFWEWTYKDRPRPKNYAGPKQQDSIEEV